MPLLLPPTAAERAQAASMPITRATAPFGHRLYYVPHQNHGRYLILGRLCWPRLVWVKRLRWQSVECGVLTNALGTHVRVMNRFIGFIGYACWKLGMPPLQAIVVNAQSRHPGPGYEATAAFGPEYRQTLLEIYDYDYPDDPPF